MTWLEDLRTQLDGFVEVEPLAATALPIRAYSDSDHFAHEQERIFRHERVLKGRAEKWRTSATTWPSTSPTSRSSWCRTRPARSEPCRGCARTATCPSWRRAGDMASDSPARTTSGNTASMARSPARPTWATTSRSRAPTVRCRGCRSSVGGVRLRQPRRPSVSPGPTPHRHRASSAQPTAGHRRHHGLLRRGVGRQLEARGGEQLRELSPHGFPRRLGRSPGAERWKLRLTGYRRLGALPDTPVGRAHRRGSLFGLLPLSPDDAQALRCYTIFPSTVILTSGGFCNWLSYLPLDPGRTRLIAGFDFPAGVAESGESLDGLRWVVQEGSDVVNGEDRFGISQVQKAAKSRLAVAGRLSPKEGALVDFYRYLGRTLGTRGVGVAQAPPS